MVSEGQKPSPVLAIRFACNTCDLSEFLSQGAQLTLRFLHLPESDILYSAGKASGNSVSKVSFLGHPVGFIKSTLIP